MAPSEPFLRFCSQPIPLFHEPFRAAEDEVLVAKWAPSLWLRPAFSTIPKRPGYRISLSFPLSISLSLALCLAVVKKDLEVPRELANFRVKEARIAIVLGTERARDYRFNGSDWIPRSSTPGWNFKDKRLRWSGVIRRLIYRRMLPVFSRVDCSFSVSSMEFYIGIQQSRGLGILNWGNLRKEKRKGTFALSKINARTFSLGNGISLFS